MSHWPNMPNEHHLDPAALLLTGKSPQRVGSYYDPLMMGGSANLLDADPTFGAESGYGLDADTPKPPETMIREFNADPAFPEYQNYGPEFDFAFDEVTEPTITGSYTPTSAAAANPSSYRLVRTNSAYSHASGGSSSFHDETSSIAFSVGSLEQFNPGSSGEGFDIISPTSTADSEGTMPGSCSLENSPIGPGASNPWVNLPATTLSGTGFNTSPTAPTNSSNVGAPFTSLNRSSGVRSISSRQSNLTLGLARRPRPRRRSGTAPSDLYFSGWSNAIVEEDAMEHGGWDAQLPADMYIPNFQADMRPPVHSLPTEMPEIRVDPFDSFDAFEGGVVQFPLGSTHPMDWISRPLNPSPQVQQHIIHAPVAVAGPSHQHLSVPKPNKRRVSDPPRLNSQSVPAGHSIQLSSSLDHPHTTAPMPIRGRPRTSRPSNVKTGSLGSSGNLKTLPASTRGRRNGPMEPVARAGARRTRNDKSVCIRCKHQKQKCERPDALSESDCFQCLQHGSTPRWPGPCVRAFFEDIVFSGTCNYISQRAINHQTIDGTRRVRKELPEMFHLDGVLRHLDKVRGRFNFRIHQAGKPIYVLDLDKSFEYLSKVRQQLVRKDYDLRAFIDKEILRIDSKTDDWETCLLDCKPKEDQLALLCVWNNMPSRASFSYVWKAGGPNGEVFDRLIDVEDGAEWDDLLLAAQLSRIMCRKLEVEAYAELQKILHKSGDLSDGFIVPFLQRLGRILITLRWRISWWRLLGDGGTSHDAGKEHFEMRVQSLCKVLYFYYCSVRRRLPAWTSQADLQGIHSSYADTATQVWDDFPGTESIQGFEQWMQRGQQLIVEAGVAGKLVGIGLTK